MGREEDIREENRKIRELRFVVDLTMSVIMQTNVTMLEASQLVEGVKGVASRLFPGKEELFELIYRPRFQRAIAEKFRSN
ncbi:MAG: hypothetical protein AB1488_11220 [Nitrospirota bacterium]